MKHTPLLTTVLLSSSILSFSALAEPVVSSPEGQTRGQVDYKNAQPLPLPQLNPGLSNRLAEQPKSSPPLGKPGFSPGSQGNGETSPVQLYPAIKLPSNSSESKNANSSDTRAYGTGGVPFTTARVNSFTMQVSKDWPYAAAGKLFFKKANGSSYICSASLIKKGLVVTAAHCVFDWGKTDKGWYNNHSFVPAYNNGSAPYGTWSSQRIYILNSYYNGTTSACAQNGVVCNNDIAIIVLAPQSSKYPGTSTGYYGYAYDGYGFTGGKTLINQLGYPGNLDIAQLMERSDSQGTTNSSMANNTVIGSLMEGGSSGGPWLNNLGIAASNSSTSASAKDSNIVVGVTSWGYGAPNSQKTQGATQFTSNNIKSLVDQACAAYPAACN